MLQPGYDSILQYFYGFAQLETLNLAGGGLRQVVDEFDPARIFVRRELAFHVLLKRGGKLPAIARYRDAARRRLWV